MTVWLTAVEAGEYVKTSERTIRDAVRAGDLPAYPIGKGREYRLTAQDVDAWMMSRSWEPTKYRVRLD
jgi:excisionase family DNA binding protein